MGTPSQPIRSSRDLGQVIAAARRQRGQSQRQVADTLGVTQAWISRVEQGRQRAWLGQVLRLMTHLGIDLACTIRDDAAAASSDDPSHLNLDDLVD